MSHSSLARQVKGKSELNQHSRIFMRWSSQLIPCELVRSPSEGLSRLEQAYTLCPYRTSQLVRNRDVFLLSVLKNESTILMEAQCKYSFTAVFLYF
jgi:hypothetical protein